MTQNDLSSPPSRTVSWRAGLRVLLGFVILYAAIWAIRVIMGVGRLGNAPDNKLMWPLAIHN